jgi:Single-strand binding protein family
MNPHLDRATGVDDDKASRYSPVAPSRSGSVCRPEVSRAPGGQAPMNPTRSARVRQAPTGVPAGSRPGPDQAEPPPALPGPTSRPAEASRVTQSPSTKGAPVMNETTLTITGSLTADPELRFTPSGIAVANFTVASNARRFDKATNGYVDVEPIFLRCTAWRTLAENAAESLTRVPG